MAVTGRESEQGDLSEGHWNDSSRTRRLSDLLLVREVVESGVWFYNRAGPQICRLVQRGFDIMLMRKNIYSQLGPCLCGVCSVLPMSPQAFSMSSGVFPHPQDAQGRWLHVSPLSRSECMWVWVALQWKGVLPRVGPALCPELPGWALATWTGIVD